MSRPPDTNGEPPAAADGHGGALVEPLPGADDDFGLAPKSGTRARGRTAVTDPLLGLDLGGIRLESLIGEGGMGRVYRASQLRPERTVAVKIVRPGLTAELAQLRLENEATFLARLQHPGIAQIHMVGTYVSDFGAVPYYVMEYVKDAETLTAHAHKHGLDDKARLQLFQQVCEAVAHGHERGVVHRDLKPGNILVDASGRPKVIDFGIARSIGGELAAHAGRTRTGQLLGTLQYMSPEQFTRSSGTLDARSDVYSLGVVLFELLSGGELPYDVQNQPPHEVSRLICQRAPRQIPAKLRGTKRSQQLSRIVARCLEKTPQRRYADAGELASAIRAYLSGSAATSDQTFFSRHTPWLSMASLGALAVVGTLLLSYRSKESPAPDGTASTQPATTARSLPHVVDTAGQTVGKGSGLGVPDQAPSIVFDSVVGDWVSDAPHDTWVKEFKADGEFFNREPDGAVHRGRWTRQEDGVVSVELNGGWKMTYVFRGEDLGITQTSSRGVVGEESLYRRKR